MTLNLQGKRIQGHKTLQEQAYVSGVNVQIPPLLENLYISHSYSKVTKIYALDSPSKK